MLIFFYDFKINLWRKVSDILYDYKVFLKFKKEFYKITVNLVVLYEIVCWSIT